MMNQNRNLQKENYETLDDLYKATKKEGSLGLLALGYRGLELWRKKRKELEKIENKGENPDAE